MAGKDKLIIGTSGFSYPDWQGCVYPEGLAANRRLEWYATQFPGVEINATYYKLLPAKSFETMARQTPDGFEFIVKTHQETTHVRRENQAAMSALGESVKPLRDNGKFSGYLAQFPYSFKNNERNRRYIAETRKLAGEDVPFFVEFRSSGWNKPAVSAFLQNLGIGYVNVDEPGLEGLLPAQEIVSAEQAYVRLHGRTQKEWWDGKGSARYDYQYTPDELREWLTRVGNILQKTYKTYIFFNNHPRGQAVKNAREMMALLEGFEGKDAAGEIKK